MTAAWYSARGLLDVCIQMNRKIPFVVLNLHLKEGGHDIVECDVEVSLSVLHFVECDVEVRLPVLHMLNQVDARRSSPHQCPH